MDLKTELARAVLQNQKTIKYRLYCRLEAFEPLFFALFFRPSIVVYILPGCQYKYMFKYYNPNPKAARVGDCTIRAISKATGQPWEETYIGLAIEGLIQADMPSSNHVWGSYLQRKGFSRHLVDGETVESYARKHPETCVLALSGHVVATQNGNYYDSWDSGQEVPIYAWKKEENDV